MPFRRARGCVPLGVLLAFSACTRGDPALGRHVDHPEFPGDVAWAFLTDQVAIGPRYAGTKPHGRAVRWLRDQLSFRADTVVLQPFTFDTAPGKRVEMTNVLARWRPAEARRILLVAHWDTHPHAEESADPADRRLPVPGANDGASGTAVLAALAEVFRQQKPEVGVDLLFTDGDDFVAGRWLGTEHYLATLPAANRPAFAVVLELVGDRDAWLPRDAGSLRHAPAVVRRVWGTAAEMRLDSVFVAETVPDSLGAHLLLSRAGIPAARLNDPEYGPGNSWFHTARDLPGATRRETLALVGGVLAEVVYRGIPAPK
ncbi:M28 family peptidase [Longimicrobium sp.]|uniref:M28 family peptidase n=1 Tax=Longimicrobium sp. TaxID=2029185 RepID=UPI002BCD9020|nr:M28 family peptidase [Longimicrobium sp.]HSU13494.1 M28 family peptidase [Longimicrobium sp.]